MASSELVALINPVESIRALLGTIFACSAALKFLSFQRFAHTVTAYQVLPPRLSKSSAVVITVSECLISIGLVTGYLLGISAWGAVLLLTSFAAAMSINLRRGRVWLSCGCFGASESRIQWHLVFRNLLLAASASLVASRSVAGNSPTLQVNISTLLGLVLFLSVALIVLLLDLGQHWHKRSGEESITHVD